MKHVTLNMRMGGGHAITDAAVCPGCRHPARLHNPLGCVRAECECPRDGQAQPTGSAVAPADGTLEDVAALVERVLEHAYFTAARWYCRSCVAWPPGPGDCPKCATALQPVYLATVPRSLL